MFSTLCLSTACSKPPYYPPSTNSSGFDPDISQHLKANTAIHFDLLSDPSSPTIIIPSYLATDAKDQTLNLEQTATNPDDITDPIVAMGKTDGWSNSQAINIDFTGNNLDPTSAANSFYLIKTDQALGESRTLSAKLLEEDVDYTVTTKNKTLTANLIKPLQPSSHYIFAITNSLKDTENEAVGTSLSYAFLKSDKPLYLPTLIDAQAITHETENIFDQLGIDKSEIIFSSWFKTASVGEVLKGAVFATAQAITQDPQSVWHGSAKNEAITDIELDSLFSFTKPTYVKNTKNRSGNIYHGEITLPYFLELNPSSYENTPWQSGMPSVAMIQHTFENGTDADISTLTEQLTSLNIELSDLTNFHQDIESKKRIITGLAGQTLTLADGSQLDSERLVTEYSPFPALRSAQTIQYSLILPKAIECQSKGANRITIYQHGVTTSKTSLENSQLADEMMRDQCRAILMINHPLHGDRGIGKANAGNDPEMYINLKSLTTARDNLRQSTLDVLNFRAAIGLLSEQISMSSDPETEFGQLSYLAFEQGVDYAGHSLGSITGVSVGSLINTAYIDEDIKQKYFSFDTLTLQNPGAQIPYMLVNSTMFGSLVKGSVAINSDPEVDKICGGKHWLELLMCYGKYENDLVNDGSEQSLTKLAELYATYTDFIFAAQTVFDTIDPTNHGQHISEQLPVYMTQVQGDKIIPNQVLPDQTLTGTDILVPYSPFAGTRPLVDALNLTVTNTSINGTPVKTASLFHFEGGNHSSILANKKNNGTIEMQSQMHSFLKSKGENLSVENVDVIE